jgi:hypothetical protein
MKIGDKVKLIITRDNINYWYRHFSQSLDINDVHTVKRVVLSGQNNGTVLLEGCNSAIFTDRLEQYITVKLDEDLFRI